jgi:peptidoglycan/xylan/chitin deacetylase (PgdA/CDA1 family)
MYETLEEFLTERGEQIVDCITDETVKLLDILDRLDLRATFFIVADVALRYPKLRDLLKNSPHEIASHSLTHRSAIDSKSKKPLQSIEGWKQDQIKAKEILEEIFEKEVIGFRAPNAYFANWMVKPLYEIGIKYDSSIAYNSLYNKTNVQLSDIPTKPYRLDSVTLNETKPGSELVELPWSNYRIGRKFILPAAGGYFFRLFGYRYFQKVLNKALKKGDTMFYLHPLDISEKKIPISNLRYRPLFWINKGTITKKRLIKLLKYYNELFLPCREIYERFIGDG